MRARRGAISKRPQCAPPILTTLRLAVIARGAATRTADMLPRRAAACRSLLHKVLCKGVGPREISIQAPCLANNSPQPNINTSTLSEP